MADSGLLHALLGIRRQRDLDVHPKVGASWEGFVLGQVIRLLGIEPAECYYWVTHAGAEIDLLVIRGRRGWGFEAKRTSTPRLTRSILSAVEDLNFTRLDVIHAGHETWTLHRRVRAVAAARLLKDVSRLR